MGFFDFLRRAASGGRGREQTLKQRVAESKLFGSPLPIKRTAASAAKGLFRLRAAREERLKYPTFEERLHRGSVAGLPDTLNKGDRYGTEFIAGEYTAVVSSWHVGAQYNRDTLELVVDFLQGGGFKVHAVDEAEALAYITAPSHGNFAWDHWLGRGWKHGTPTLKVMDWF